MSEVLGYGTSIQTFIYKNFLEALTHEGVAPLLAIGMLCLAFAIWLWIYFFYIRSNMRALESAQKALASIEGQESFKEQFATIDGKLSKISIIQRGWAEFRETIVIPREDDLVQVIRNTIRPGFYLNIDEIENSFRLRRLNSASNFMVGLGLLLTFIGLVAALAQASAALGPANADFKEPIMNLLKVASVKFWTSVAGLMCSMALKWIYNHQHEKLRDVLLHINDKIELGLQFVTPEYLAIEQLREAQEQTKSLKNFSTDFALSLAGTLQPVFSNAVAPLGETLREIDRKFAGGIGDVVQGVAGDEIRQMTNMLGGVISSLGNSKTEMDGIGAVIREAAEKLRDASVGASEDVMKQLNTVMNSMADRDKERTLQLDQLMEKIKHGVEQSGLAAGEQMKQVASDIATGMSGVSDGVRMSAQAMAEQMERVSGELKRIEESMKGCVKDMDSLVGRASETERAMSATSHHLTEATQPVVRATENIAAGTQRVQIAVESAQRSISDSHAGLLKLTEQLGQSQSVLQHAWENYYQRFSNVDDSLGKVLVGIIDSVSNISQSMQTFVSGMDGQLSSVVQAFSANISELNDTAENFEGATEKLLTATDAIVRNGKAA